MRASKWAISKYQNQQFGRIIVFNAILFGVGVHSALKSPFTFASFSVNEPQSNVSDSGKPNLSIRGSNF